MFVLLVSYLFVCYVCIENYEKTCNPVFNHISYVLKEDYLFIFALCLGTGISNTRFSPKHLFTN